MIVYYAKASLMWGFFVELIFFGHTAFGWCGE